MESGMDSFYRLSDDERKAIAIGLKDTKENRVYSSKAADNMIAEWQKSRMD